MYLPSNLLPRRKEQEDTLITPYRIFPYTWDMTTLTKPSSTWNSAANYSLKQFRFWETLWMGYCRRWIMKHKKDFFLDLLENYFDTYLPVAKRLLATTITSYKAAFRILLEFIYTIKATPADRINFEILNSQVITELLDWLESERGCK